MTAQFDDVIARAQVLLAELRERRVHRVPEVIVPTFAELPSIMPLLADVRRLRVTSREAGR